MRPARSWSPDLLGAVAAASVVVVVALWLHGAGLRAVTDGGTAAFSSLGRLTGLVAGDLLLAQVFLMARVPWLERAFGQDRLARWHRCAGLTSFWLMCAHVVLITIGYAGAGHTDVFTEAWELAVDYPGMLLAVAGTAALVAVVALSIRRARRRLRYESWHLLHLYAYLGVGLALPHQLWTGTDFVSSPAARAYWWSAYACCAGSVLVFRVALPLWRSHRHGLRVERVVRETADVFSVHLAGRHLHRMPVRAGQFFTFRFLTGTGWTRAHPFSLSAAPGAERLRITVRSGGDDARRIACARPGTRVLIEGPYGRLTARARTRRQVLLLGAGIGITPLRALLEELPFRPGEAVLVYRASTADDFALRAELDELARRRGVAVHYLPGPAAARGSWLPAWLGHLSDEEALLRIAPGVRDQDVFVCGPELWMAAVRTALRHARVPNGQIHYESFAW
ncbi:ferric reductase-like transmembrane domain-containing protein [Asanoa iriomotensis]|uniref:Oxidoreductase n=1 Tax=Asanoa iriomotensis TaxID=234613 RepID=A0ABQ4CCL1_9ACTN|nr:oxidoreductase [Asanoa iriomotensis]